MSAVTVMAVVPAPGCGGGHYLHPPLASAPADSTPGLPRINDDNVAAMAA
ncbi:MULTISPECIES: hypothetical protein [Streptomyces]|uniref:Uncharacterized protein n=1 Tax=Streptomyces avermitilis TaxID=33903 RepID=A0A4D4N520_STRAX|nr:MULTISPECIES: hypothetical protein [Streptomyces]BBJ48242.1 hypothetical protein SAVMC3_08710 [Streptomyces avermitilis]GDY69392.1 hypothetical protein SAV14893_087850 [Streptomyces avermitilis]GDY79642.1 hypothetical protein SAV31267_091270 [Streptomyces avermitilis]